MELTATRSLLQIWKRLMATMMEKVALHLLPGMQSAADERRDAICNTPSADVQRGKLNVKQTSADDVSKGFCSQTGHAALGNSDAFLGAMCGALSSCRINRMDAC